MTEVFVYVLEFKVAKLLNRQQHNTHPIKALKERQVEISRVPQEVMG